MSEKTTDARECPRCHKQTLGPWVEDNGRTLIGDRCGACNATWMLDVPQRIAPPGDAVERVTDEELAEVEKLDEEATEGPWTTDGGQVVETEYQIDPEADEGERADVCEVLHYGRDRGPFRTGTARFIARARTLLPRFRGEVIALRAEIERLKRENAVLADDAARAPGFVPFAGGEIS